MTDSAHPHIEAADLRLRAVEPGDAELLFLTENDTEAWPDSDTVAPYSRHVLKEYAEAYRADPFTEGQLRLIAEERATGKPMAIVDLYDISLRHRHAFVALYVLPIHRRQGCGSAALNALAYYAKRHLGLKSLCAKVRRDNTPSQKLFQSCAYQHAGTLSSWCFTPAGSVDILLFQTVLGN